MRVDARQITLEELAAIAQHHHKTASRQSKPVARIV